MRYLKKLYSILLRKIPYLKLIDLVRQFWLSLPREIALELTNDCNLKCAKCPTYETNRTRGIFSEELFDKLLSDIRRAPRGSTILTFTGSGEPTLHPRLASFVKKAKCESRVKEVKLVTNALDLTPELVDQLTTVKIDTINVSLDTLDSVNYLKINRVDGLDKVLGNIDYLIKNRGEIKIHLKVTLYREDQKLIDKIKSKFDSEFDSIRFTGLHNWLGLRGKTKIELDVKGACHYPFYQAQILWDGQITLCCHDCMEGRINMGNLKDKTLFEHWKSMQMMSQRWAQISGQLNDWDVCKNCDAYKYDYEKKL